MSLSYNVKNFLSKARTLFQKQLCCQIPFRYLNAVYFPHPVGIVIGSQVQIGKGVTIYQNVSIGRRLRAPDDGNSYPTIGDNVLICAGAVIGGKIKIGENVIIGANAVVTRDVPDDSIAYGYNQIKSRIRNSNQTCSDID